MSPTEIVMRLDIGGIVEIEGYAQDVDISITPIEGSKTTIVLRQHETYRLAKFLLTLIGEK